MLGRTHFFVGTAAALLLCQPQTLPVLLTGTGAAAIGGILPDIDSRTSKAHKSADLIIGVTFGAAAVIILTDFFFHTGIYRLLVRQERGSEILLRTAVFLAVCIFGMNQPHRSFMHSIPALLLLAWYIDGIFPNLTPYFIVGYASHLAADLPNRRPERLLWPLKKGICLHLCDSDGTVNKIMMTGGIFLTILLFVLAAGRIFFRKSGPWLCIISGRTARLHEINPAIHGLF